MGRCEERKLFHCGQKCVVDELRFRKPSSMNSLEPNRANFGQACQRLAFACDGADALADCSRIIGALAAGLANPLHTPLSQQRLHRACPGLDT